MLVIQVVQLRWNKFYDLLIRSDEKFRLELKKYVEMKDDTRMTNLDLEEVKEGENNSLDVRKVLRNFKTESELWNFLVVNFDTLNNIKDWTIYRRATQAITEPSIQAKEIAFRFLAEIDISKVKLEFISIRLREVVMRKNLVKDVETRSQMDRFFSRLEQLNRLYRELSKTENFLPTMTELANLIRELKQILGRLEITIKHDKESRSLFIELDHRLIKLFDTISKAYSYESMDLRSVR